jgi:hypothetical protein
VARHYGRGTDTISHNNVARMQYVILINYGG